MKKCFLLGILSSVLFFTGCSSNVENDMLITDPLSGTPALLSKITTVYYDNPTNPETNVATLEYNSQKQVIKTISEGRTAVFEYDTAGKPIKTNYYKPNGTLDYYSTYTYNGEQLTTLKSIYSNPNYNRTITYSYSNGKLTGHTLCQSADCTNPSTSSYTYNGENISAETSVNGGAFSFSTKSEYSYDNKLNPFSYINKYIRTTMGGAYVLSPNNYTTEKISYKDNEGNWIPSQNITFEIQYNNLQLPTQVIGKEADGSISVKYSYEYITQ